MKIVSLFYDFRPRLKCGEAVSTVTSMLGGFYGTKASQENVSHQLSVQKSENALNRDWQTLEAEKARQFEAGQVLQQNQFQQGLQAQQQQYNLQSMQKQAEYNSPGYMRQQLSQAGINPQVYFGNHASFSGSSAVSGGSPSAPAPAKGVMPGSVQGISPVGFQPSFLNPYELMSGVGNLLEGLANAKKAGVETTFLERSLESRIQKALSEGNMAKQQELLSELDVAFKRANFGTALNTVFAQYKKVLSEIDLNSEKKLTEIEEQKLKRATAAMNNSIQALNDEEKRKLGITISYLPRLLESEILSNRGSAAAGFGKAEESRANASVLKEEKRIRTVAANIREKGETKELQSVLDELNAKQAVSQEQYHQASLSIKKLKAIIDEYGTDAGRTEFDAELQNFFNIIGLRASIHN